MTGQSAQSHEHTTRTADRALLGLAVAYFLLLWVPSFVGPYGYFIDELYYLASTRHLAFGYVDHPPLSVFLLAGVRTLLGDSLPALRLVPALAGAATIFLTGHIARRLGAGPFGQILAAGAAMAGAIWHVLFSFYSMNALAVLLWAICFWILVEIERRDEPRLWLAFGAVAGLGLLNKHTIVLLALGLGVGLVLTRARRHLAGRWIWIGLGLAALLFLPNALWQLAHDWPSLEFYRNATLLKNVPTAPHEILIQQALFMNPAALPVWLAGLVFFLATERGRPWRHLGWIWPVLLLVMVAGQQSRPDRIAAGYTVLFAGGGVLLGDLTRRGRGRWLRAALPALLILTAGVLAPLALPVLPPPAAASWGQRLGIVPQIEQGPGKRASLPQWLADRTGWERLVADVTAVVGSLDPDERERAFILAPSYGQAGALDVLGRDLPPVHSGHNSYHFWGPPESGRDVAVVIGFDGATLRRFFEDVTLARVHDCAWCLGWRDESPIWVARGMRVPIAEVWPLLKHYE